MAGCCAQTVDFLPCAKWRLSFSLVEQAEAERLRQANEASLVEPLSSTSFERLVPRDCSNTRANTVFGSRLLVASTSVSFFHLAFPFFFVVSRRQPQQIGAIARVQRCCAVFGTVVGAKHGRRSQRRATALCEFWCSHRVAQKPKLPPRALPR